MAWDALAILRSTKAADGGRLAKTAGTVLQPELNDDGLCRLMEPNDSFVRADGGNVQNARFDAFNGKARQIVRGVPGAEDKRVMRV